MTAPNTTRSRSDNSVRYPDGNGASGHAPERDLRHRRIVHYANETCGSTTRKDIIIKSGWEHQTVNQLLVQLADDNLVHLIEDEDCCIVLLTVEGEHLAQEVL